MKEVWLIIIDQRATPSNKNETSYNIAAKLNTATSVKL